MTDHLSMRTREAIAFAQEEAARLGRDRVSGEHLLLGLVRQGRGLAAAALTATGVTVEVARAQVVSLSGRGAFMASGDLPLEPTAELVLEIARAEAEALGEHVIDPEHLLIALMDERAGISSRVLLDLGMNAAVLRSELVSLSSWANTITPARGGRCPHCGSQLDAA